MSHPGCQECRALDGHHAECKHFGECRGCGRQLRDEPHIECNRVTHWHAWHETHITLSPEEVWLVWDTLKFARKHNEYSYAVAEALLARLETIPHLPTEMARLLAQAKREHTR